MGALVVKAYPTKLFAKAADHTYVECGTGALGWSCWGGKTGGAPVRQANGSTKRANDIAQPNERAGVTCYLVNGVCHQAANRVLLPASITVNGARGYALSSAIYGVYGRAGAWPCSAAFDQHPMSTGDLPGCVAPPTVISAPTRTDLDDEDARYLAEVVDIYRKFDRVLNVQSAREEREDFHVQLFAHMVDFHLGSDLGDRRQVLLEIRRATEQRQQNIEERVASEGLPQPELIDEINDLTLEFQANLAQATTDEEYERLLQLPKTERIVLADPDVTGLSYA